MEKIFSFGLQPAGQPHPEQNPDTAYLRRQHLWLPASVVATILDGSQQQVYAAFEAATGRLLLASMADQAFKAAHECVMIMAKLRNADGDRSLSLQPFFIDYALDDTDRPLDCEVVGGKLLSIALR
ncbi:MAG: hypothetical protein OHK0039_26750 [Bacteroidia bacterium]